MRERSRFADYPLLLAVAAALTLPNLGAASLWDVDEGVNAEAAREMQQNGTWVIPTFNFELRTAKPVMLYWLQRISYAMFGISEWSARLPSVLCAWLTVLLTYELARRMFGRATGLLAGIVLASALEFCVLAHAATPDAPLLLFTVLTYFLFWFGHENGSAKWWVPTAMACGLACLTKGPVGVALPGLVFLLYFGWNRELRRLLDLRIVAAFAAFLLIAGPWYGFVAAETRGAWPKAFFLNENVNRALSPKENHSGPIVYHAAVLFVLFAPWSVFLIGAVWTSVTASKTVGSGRSAVGSQGKDSHCNFLPTTHCALPTAEPRPYRFLLCWFAAYLTVFSLAATKLPNYVLPLYPAIAILTARYLVRWRDERTALPRWWLPTSVAGMAVVGVVCGIGLLVASRTLPGLPDKARAFPALAPWAALGFVPLAGAAFMARALRRGNRNQYVAAMSAASVAFVALLAAFPAVAMDEYKSPRELVRAAGLDDPTRDVRAGTFDWFQPSVVFYSQREMRPLESPDHCAEFLAVPTPGYLFVPEPTWNQWIANRVKVPHRIVARRYDFYRNCDVLVIANDAPPVPPLAASR